METTFAKPGETFAGRPRSSIMDILFKGNYGLMLNENDIYKPQRRFALQTLKNFGFGKSEFEPFIIFHIEESIEQELRRNNYTTQVNTKRIFSVANANVMHKLVFGGTLKDNDEIMRLKIAVENVFMDWYKPSWMLLEVMPWLIWLEKFKIYDFGVKRAASYNDVFINFLEHHIKLHKEKRKNGNTEENDYVDCFLAEMEKNNNFEQGFKYWQFVIACYDLWAAGVETVTTTLQFAILYLIHNQEVQTKLKKELHEFQAEITVANLKKLNYLNAFVQEVHRLANVIPLSLIHETLEPTEIENYKFETGTCVIAQLACFNLNPLNFPNPTKFKPERHLDSLTEFSPNPLLKPFSIGKRSCLGESLARPQLLLILTVLFKKYRVKSLYSESLPNINARPGLVRVLDDFDCILVEEE
uniref:Cytochrome P450 n=1 Tax=Panagrolaimus sp. PS1159 TaxID=55785 RepID=A0AC35GL42_9BILA